MKRFLYISFAITLISIKSFAQGEIPVDMYTGQPSIGIPVTTLTSNDIVVPVTLTYDANDGDNKSVFGYGWNVSAGGAVSRELRGLPDDFGNGDTRKGWLYNNSAGISIASDIGNYAFLNNEATNNTKLASLGYVVDPEPDIFNFSFGNLSGSFVFGNDLTIRTIPYRDIKIEPTYASATDKKIISFKITTNDGYSYTFAELGTATRSAGRSQYVDNVFFLSTDYELYNSNVYPAVAYNAKWHLSKIESPGGAFVNFSYGYASEDAGKDINIGFYTWKDPIMAGSTDLEVRKIYGISQPMTIRNISAITGSTGATVSFVYDERLTAISISDSRKTPAYIKQFNLSYTKVDFKQDYYVSYSKYFLSAITELSGCERMPPVRMSYNGIDGSSAYDAVTLTDAWGYESGYASESHRIPKLYIYPAEPEEDRYRLLPIPNYSGQEIILNGVNRNASTLNKVGTLSSITYPHGSRTDFGFEGNSYLDTRTNLDASAGGLRINRISYFDGFNPIPVTKTFEYTDANGKSSGRLLRKPVFTVPAYKWKNPFYLRSTSTAYEKNYSDLTGNDLWKYLTMRTDSDIAPSENTKGNTVGYTFVTVKRPGAGKATFEYYAPGTYGQSTSGEWTATSNYFARPATPASSMGVISSAGPWRFPHAPNPSFDYERGLLWRKSDYNEAGKLIQKTETSYQYLYKSGTAPVKVWGLRYDKFALSDDIVTARKIFMYGKYFLLTDTERAPWVETQTTYDVNDATATRYTTASTEYLYQGINHKLLTQVKSTSSDGNVRRSYLKYPNDFTNITTNAENAVTALSYMSSHSRYGAPVETITTLQRGSGPERVTDASMVKFDAFGATNPLPESVWTLSTKSSIHIDSFKNSSVMMKEGMYKLDMDTRYEKKTSFTSYTTAGQLSGSREEISRMSSATFYGTTNALPVTQVANASRTEVAFSDFESATGAEFSRSAEYYGSGRSGNNAFYPGGKLSKTLTKGSTTNYILSFWIKSNATVNFTVTLKNAAGSSTYSTVPVTVVSTGGTEFKYVQKIIPVSAVPAAGSFLLELQAASLPAIPAGGSSSGLLPVIDDVFFFPEQAQMTSFVYQLPYGVSTVTTGTGDATHTVYDNLGRMKYAMDRDRNITRRSTYNFASSENPLVAEFRVPSTVIVNESKTFTGTDNPCVSDETYWWDWGNGYVQGTSTISHTFTSTGSVNVKLKVSSLLYGDKTFSARVSVQPKPVVVTACAKGVMVFNGASSTITSTYTCPEITATPPTWGTIFRVTSSMAECTDGCSYKWIMQTDGNIETVIVGYGPQYTFQKVTSATRTFTITCEMTTEDGTVVKTMPMQVTVIQPN